MTTFPTLIPSTRTFTPGFYPYTPFTGMSGRANRVRNSNAMLESQLRLTFAAITEAEMLSILTHYNGQQGSFASFVLPTSVWSGGTAADFQLTGYSWIYKEPPTVEDLMCGGHNVELLLETVPPEGISLPGGSNTSGSGVTPGTVTTAPGGTGSVSYELDPGLTAVGGFSGAIGYSLAAGEVDSGSTDPDFASVSLLLHFDGSNGSTTFTDSSSAARTVTANGNAQISTAQSKFGGASGYFDGSGDFLDVAGNADFSFSGAFSVQGWVRLSSVGTQYRTLCEIGTYVNGVLIRLTSATSDCVYVNGTNLGNITPAFTANTWAFVSVTRDASNLVQVAVDGTVLLSATKAGTVNSTNGGLCIGQPRHTTGQGYDGWIDDFRVTNGVARPHTPPTAPFPDS